MRGGFQVTEEERGAPERADRPPPDLLLYAVAGREPRLADLVRELTTGPRYGGAPVLVLALELPEHYLQSRLALIAGARDYKPRAPLHIP